MADRKEKQQAAKPAVFMPAELIAGAAHFNTSPEMMAGALHGVSKSITTDEAAKRLERFKNKPAGAKEE